MIEIKKILKKDIDNFFNDKTFWDHSFLAITKHRLLAHSYNPNSNEDDIVLLLAYLDNELVGYMGLFIDKIILNKNEHKIGWLSTWWVHPKTQGSGIGREILKTMYEANNGKIGISQFTASARRVYDKSGYFTSLKENIGIKAVLKSNLNNLIPVKYPKLKIMKFIFKFFDFLLNKPIELKLKVQKFIILSNLKNIEIEYLNIIDFETNSIIDQFNKSHIAKKTPAFFEWLKAFQWVQEAPLLKLTQKNKYEFSSFDENFNIYLIKIIENNICIGFTVLQKRNKTMKVLFAYYDKNQDIKSITNVIKLHAISLKMNEIICYDIAICEILKKSNIFIYKRKKIKQSIISKIYEKTNFDDVEMNFGDGDCSFA
jgi:GNAT superfamily N-acetyltransferase